MIEEWAERNDIELDDDDRVSRGENHVTFTVGGDIVLQGEPVDLDGEWIIVEGSRYYWDHGRVQKEGRFALKTSLYDDFAIDGPLP